MLLEKVILYQPEALKHNCKVREKCLDRKVAP